jgi:hypothetical protein
MPEPALLPAIPALVPVSAPKAAPVPPAAMRAMVVLLKVRPWTLQMEERIGEWEIVGKAGRLLQADDPGGWLICLDRWVPTHGRRSARDQWAEHVWAFSTVITTPRDEPGALSTWLYFNGWPSPDQAEAIRNAIELPKHGKGYGAPRVEAA